MFKESTGVIKISRKLLFCLVLSVFLSELILIINAGLGFLFYVFLITGCLIVLSKIDNFKDLSKLIVIFLIIPIIRVASLFLDIAFFWKVAVFYYLLFFLVSFYCLKFKINPGYTKKWLFLIPLIIVLGGILGVFGYYLFNIEKYFGLIFLIPLIAYSEEVLFRGMMQQFIKKNYGVVLSILIPAFLYGLFSLGYGILAVFLGIVGLVSGIVYSFTKNIYLCIILNMIVHVFLFVLG